ncbi:hypothetical protein, partial [Pseudomonas syringae group genomosp. 7]|uniref:hypothetical protein n=1 Tax=Pseudomonas syringae group genomosp. 7 TaxID=251699 RepID=UPI00376FD848
ALAASAPRSGLVVWWRFPHPPPPPPVRVGVCFGWVGGFLCLVLLGVWGVGVLWVDCGLGGVGELVVDVVGVGVFCLVGALGFGGLVWCGVLVVWCFVWLFWVCLGVVVVCGRCCCWWGGWFGCLCCLVGGWVLCCGWGLGGCLGRWRLE